MFAPLAARNGLALWPLAALALGCAAWCGCSGGTATYPVQGTATLDGQPLPDATLSFHPVDRGRPAVGQTDAQGRFQLTTLQPNDGALAGEYRITVEAWDLPPVAGEAGNFLNAPKGRPPPPPKSRVHENYRNAAQTPLRATVPGPELSLQLKSDGT